MAARHGGSSKILRRTGTKNFGVKGGNPLARKLDHRVFFLGLVYCSRKILLNFLAFSFIFFIFLSYFSRNFRRGTLGERRPLSENFRGEGHVPGPPPPFRRLCVSLSLCVSTKTLTVSSSFCHFFKDPPTLSSWAYNYCWCARLVLTVLVFCRGPGRGL